jgi:transcriptional regulator with XRE-family HTH domain
MKYLVSVFSSSDRVSTDLFFENLKADRESNKNLKTRGTLLLIISIPNNSVDSDSKRTQNADENENMGNEFFELCHESLAVLLKERNLSQAELAHRLDMSKKTVQRWINRTTRRISAETLHQLAEALGTQAERLTRSTEKIQIRPFNAGLKELTTEEYLIRVRLNCDWHSYQKILLSFPAQEIPSLQQVLLFKNLGVANIYLGKLRAAKTYLQKSLAVAKTLDDESNQAMIYSWLAIREALIGNLSEAFLNIQKAEEKLPANAKSIVKSTFYFIKGRIFFHAENTTEAKMWVRKAIRENYHAPEGSLRVTAVFYAHLAWVYLRDHDLHNARIALRRTQFYAEKIGWVRGVAIAHTSLAFIDRLKNLDSSDLAPNLRRGRQLYKSSQGLPLDMRLEQVEFILSLLNEDYEKAKIWAQRRLTASQATPIFLAYAILDVLFLTKLNPGIFQLRPSLIEKAQAVFSDNSLTKSVASLDFLLSKKSITREDFIKHYIF